MTLHRVECKSISSTAYLRRAPWSTQQGPDTTRVQLDITQI